MLTFPLSFKHNYRHHTTKAKTKLSGAPANDLLFLFISAHVIPQMISTKIHTEASRDRIPQFVLMCLKNKARQAAGSNIKVTLFGIGINVNHLLSDDR